MLNFVRLRERHYRGSTIRLAAIAAALFVFCPPAWADVVGRLRVTVTDSSTNKPISKAAVTFSDTAGVRADINMTTGDDGSVTSPLLENHAWEIDTSAEGYADDSRSVTVVSDTTTDVNVALTPKQEKVITITATRNAVNKSNTQDSTVRSRSFIAKTPAGNGNSQSLGNLLITNPGMVQSTNNQVHPRGEHASTTIDIDGAELPDATIGRGGQFISPEVLQSADIITGAYAPEYGSEAAAVLNLNLRQGTITPFADYSVLGGGFDTWQGDMMMGGQSGDPLEPGVDNGPKKFRYFVDLNNRFTDNALEPPQPDPQDAHNAQTSSTMLGHFDYLPNVNDDFSLTLNTTPAVTETANRTGLSSYYAPVGQGYGYGGARNANGYLPGWSAASVAAAGANAPLGAYYGGNQFASANGQGGIASQQSMGQDDYQDDNNTFGLLNYRHTFDPQTTGLVSFSQTQSVTQLRNNNPANDILDEVNADGTLTTTDNSIEYNPDMTRIYNQSQIQGNLTKSEGAHTYKAGIIFDDQQGNESYQFTPQSQLALDALANIYSFAQNPQNVANPLLPAGSYMKDSHGNLILDALGNPIWTMAHAGETFPTMTAHKTGYYGAAYVQDTWNESSHFTVNYGFRYDMFHQTDAISSTDGISSTNSLTDGVLSPRVNTAYALARGTIARVSYDHLFTQPPLAQGAIVGQVIKPETWDQYETSVERQLSSRQTAKIDYYYKNIRNQDDTGILIPFTQIGALTTLNYQYASVHGLECSYNMNPRDNVGVGEFVNYTYSVAKPGGLNEVGTQAPYINDHNQYDTASAGVNYTWRSQAYTSATFYYGSGEASSVLGPVSTAPGPDAEPSLQDGHTIPRTQVDLRLTSSPKMLGFASMQLDIINLFDSIAVDNFNSGFSGTRFQQARTYMVSVNGHF